MKMIFWNVIRKDSSVELSCEKKTERNNGAIVAEEMANTMGLK